MRILALVLLLAAPAFAQKKKPAPKAQAPADDGVPTTTEGGKKAKSYTFTGLDIDGKLKTPQLLYFLNRMKSELDTTQPDKRSFIPVLERSTDEM